jgi:alcohol dehydrogenase
MQQVIQGENSLLQAGELIRKTGCTSVFVITGEHLHLDEQPVFLQNLTISSYKKRGANVEEQEILSALAVFNEQQHTALLAIGGGSVIDLAKAIIYKRIQSSLSIPFFIAAPTTAGSGSEATHFAVVYQGNKKISLLHRHLLPQVVVLDPELTYSLSAYQTAVSGMDVLAQAIESYWNKNATTESKKFASDAIQLWRESFLKAVHKPSSEAREKMLLAAHLAGKAINITRTTGPHALSYFLTAYHHVPHGQAVALFLPLFFIYNNPGHELCSLLRVSDASAAKEMIRQLMQDAGLKITLAELGINKTAIVDVLLDEVNEERFANNPVAFDRDRLKELIIQYL